MLDDLAEAIRSHRAGDLDAAERLYRAAGDSVEALCNWGLVAKARGDLAKAETLLRRAAELDPAHPFPAYNLGSLYWRTGRLAQALGPLELAAADPAMTGARENLANVYLALGRDAEGWRLYDERPERLNSPARRLSFPEWRGEPLAGKRLFILAEQGFGDMILAARFLHRLDAAHVTLLCPPALVRLFSRLSVEVVARDGDIQVSPHDYWALPLSLPRWVEPIAGPYLTGTPAKTGRIGVAWKGNARPDPGRSLPPDLGAALLSRPGAVSLHPEDTGAADFQDTADIIAGLDAVVSVDTSVAHLAGAMGKRVIVLLQHHTPEWRWRASPAWYPTAQILRQPTPGDWRGAVAAVRD